jgi:hypothetical protein
MNDLEYYKEMELRYNDLLDSTSSKRLAALQLEVKKYKTALNKIGMLAMGGSAYTKEFTEQVEQIVREALKVEKRWPY